MEKCEQEGESILTKLEVCLGRIATDAVQYILKLRDENGNLKRENAKLRELALECHLQLKCMPDMMDEVGEVEAAEHYRVLLARIAAVK